MDASFSLPQVFSFEGLVVPAIPDAVHDRKRIAPPEADPKTITRVLHTEGFGDSEGRTIVVGDQLLRFQHPETDALLEVWMRRSGQNENLRIIVLCAEAEGPAGRYWDLGPTLRRNLGGAIVPDGISEEVVGIGGRQYRAIIEARSGGLSTFTLESHEHPNRISESPERLIFSIVDPRNNTPCSLTAAAQGWSKVDDKSESDPGRLFRMVEDWRKQALQIQY